jgi:hypothetical protein
MGRIGSQYAQARIYDLNTREFQPAFEPFEGQNAMIMYDSADKMPMQLSHTPFKNNFKYSNMNATSYHNIKDRLKRINNKTEYEIKAGKRVEGLQASQVFATPYINIQENYENFSVPQKLQNLSASEQYKATNVYPKVNIEPTYLGKAVEFNNKTQQPYQIEIQNNLTPMEFIKSGMGKTYATMSKNNAVDNMGSTLKQNYAVEANQPVVPKTGFQLYKDYLENRHTHTGINARQIDNLKSRQILGTYSGMPSQGGIVPQQTQKP